MSTPQALQNLGQTLSSFWGARNEREKKQIMLAIMVAVLGLVYMLLVEPAWKGREQLKKNLPNLRQQAAEMQTLAKEAANLANTGAPPPVDMTKETLDAALTRHGLKAQTVTVQGNIAKVQLTSVSFAGIVSWLDEMQKGARASVTEANITAAGSTDSVNATLTLRQLKNE